MSQKIRDHELLHGLYKSAEQYADLLDAAGNSAKAEQVREECRAVAREHVLDRVLTVSRFPIVSKPGGPRVDRARQVA